MKVTSKLNLDKLGAYASAACAVHCLLSGLALGLMSVVGLGFIGSSTTDHVFLIVTLSIASLAIVSGYRKHRSWVPAILFGAGAFSITLSHLVLDGDSKNTAMRIVTTLLAVSGGLLLVVFHIVNRRLQMTCQHNA